MTVFKTIGLIQRFSVGALFISTFPTFAASPKPILPTCAQIIGNASLAEVQHVTWTDSDGNLHQKEELQVIVSRPEGDGTIARTYDRTDRSLLHIKKYQYYPDSLMEVKELVGKKVLDIGTGGGTLVTELRTLGVDAHGLDIYLNESQRKLNYFHQKDALHTELASDQFDVIYSTISVFSYERENRKLLTQLFLETRRLLKPGGKLRLSPIEEKQVRAALDGVPGMTVSKTPPSDWHGQKFIELEKTFNIANVDSHDEPFTNAYATRDGDTLYYGRRLTRHDKHFLEKESQTVRLDEKTGNVGTARDYDEYARRLGLGGRDVGALRGRKVLSVGEGNSNFTSEMAKRGVDSQSVDALVVNPHAPNRSIIAMAQELPFKDQEFDATVSVWLVPHFFRPTAGSSMFNPEAGRQAIKEMLRVTKIGGEIRINPILSDGNPIIDFLDKLKKLGFIDFEVSPRVSVEMVKRNTQDPNLYPSLKNTTQNTYAKIKRLK